MNATGNGKSQLCAANLLVLTRGEVPYERCKGLDGRLIDSPNTVNGPLARADIQWQLNTYEPRIDLNALNISAIKPELGQFGIETAITKKGGG